MSWRRSNYVYTLVGVSLLLLGVGLTPGGVEGQPAAPATTTTTSGPISRSEIPPTRVPVSPPGPAPEQPCEDGTWFCGRAIGSTEPECIPQDWRCDGKIDCQSSESDELYCPTVPGESPCKANETACQNGECIPAVFLCDRQQDCPDDFDENNCTYTPCPAGSFTCKNNRHCVNQSDVCNGINDCGDRTDEAEEFCAPKTCLTGEFLCKNSNCIDASLVCSGSDECGDGSDEDKSCGVDECSSPSRNNCSDICKNINIKYKCSCRPGRELMKDQQTCQDINECEKTPLMCSQFCTNTEGSFSCSCATGYTLTADGSTCRRTDQSIEPFLIFANRYQLRRISLNGTVLGRANEENDYVHVLDYYYKNKTIFFADAGKGQIRRMLFNGSDEQVVIKHNLPLVEGLAVDWINEKLYWTDSRMSGLFVANMNGTMVKELHTERTQLPRAIIVHPARGYLYWSDWQLGAFIGRLDMDGSNMKKLIKDGLFWPNALTIDYITERLWWADAHLDKIETAKIDGTGRYQVGEKQPHIYGINIFEEWMYWTDWNIKTIERANRFNGSERQQLAKMTHQPYDIHVVHPLRQNMSIVNPCAGGNGGCSHLCLLAPGTEHGKPGYKCACPKYFILGSDQKTCSADCDPDTQFECGRDDHRCIPKRWTCDKTNDCAGGEDEANCPAVIQCDAGKWACDTNNECVNDPRDVCDKVDDCTDGSDEDEEMCKARKCLPSEYRCATGRCIPEKWKCDNDPDCPDGDDEDKCDIPRNCTLDEFSCDNGKCIPELWKCDYDDDCGDASDEPRDICITKSCPHGWEKCKKNYRCIPSLMKCDGDDDCRDNSDEDPKDCPACGNGEWECSDQKQCIPERWRCDFEEDCDDGSDEDTEKCKGIYVKCEENEFRCKNEKCIRDRYRCDHDDDCEDGSDEEECANNECADDTLFQCKSGHCVLGNFQCDGIKHCEDLSDETDCPTRFPNGRYCSDNEFQCNTTICIPPTWVCDAEDDCGDRSDEVPAICKDRPCDDADRFKCDNGFCLRRIALCDGVDDCGDGSDENNFTICTPPTTQCSPEEFKCSKGNCVPMALVCNEQNDCGDDSDEHGCHEPGTGSCDDDNGGCEKVCTQVGARYFCQCNGTGFRIDPANKKLCIDVDECAAYRTNQCDQICVNTDGSHVCKCATDFKAVKHRGGRVCKAEFSKTETILIAMENSIRQYRLSQKLYTDVITSRSEVRALDVDGVNNLVYWTDPRRKTAFRAWVPNNASQVSQPQDLEIYSVDVIPEGIAYDWYTDNIYITDSKAGRIIVGKSDGRYLKTIISSSPRRPLRIALSPELGLMFWVDIMNKKIESAWMDGSNIKVVVNLNISDPTSIVVDHYMGSRLYWADVKRNVIESSKVDGTDRVIVAHNGLRHPFAIDVFESQLYWVSQQDRALYNMDKFGRGVNVSHTIQNNLLRPQDVKVQHQQKQPPIKVDRCSALNCYPLCVLIPGGGRCLCPDGSAFTRSNVCNTESKAPLSLPEPCTCENGGTCALQPDLLSVYCLCKPDFHGSNCEIKVTPPTTTVTTTTAKTSKTAQTSTGVTDRNTGEVTKGPPPGNNAKQIKGGKRNDDLTAVIVPIVIVLILLIVAVVIVAILYRRGVIGGAKKSGHGVFRPGAPGGQENGMDTHYETPVVTFDPKDDGHANASFNNPYYEVVQPNSEALGTQEYATTLPTKS